MRTSKPSPVSEIAGAHQHAFVLLTAGSGGGRSKGCNFSEHELSNIISASRKQSDSELHLSDTRRPGVFRASEGTSVLQVGQILLSEPKKL